ncbi:HAD family hydrolase [Arthrobacter sp. AOP36-A1-22]|uniref:HAD family hydrolase n=1 Tax=Arthrobacter sp. AOP36-A1-22 TaxID=3457684 RepID=UPI0040343542
MTQTQHDAGWYLFDYGMVIAAAPAAGDWDRLEQTAGRELRAPGSTYWAHRHSFDAGALDSPLYWSAVLERPVEPAEAENLDRLDTALWSQPDPRTREVLRSLESRGASMAVLSNMPARMSQIFEAEGWWTGYFEHLIFSGPLRLAKPDPRIYEHALATMGAEASDVVFIDDKRENIDAAAALGLGTVHYTAGTDLAAELGL